MSLDNTVINFSEARDRIAKRKQTAATGEPAWKDDIRTCCAYARMLRAEHDAESARIHFDARSRGVGGWNEADDLIERTQSNNLEWDRYIGVLRHLANLPAQSRAEASDKRNTIGKMWLAPDVSCTKLFGPLRAGCIRDDHLFPPSMKLARR